MSTSRTRTTCGPAGPARRGAAALTAANEDPARRARARSCVLRAAAAAAAGVASDGEDAQALFGMHAGIKQALGASPRAEAGGTGAMPAVWVSRWVDYSKKYGLGYKLSNGCSGVFFNDATKMLLATGAEQLLPLPESATERRGSEGVQWKGAAAGVG